MKEKKFVFTSGCFLKENPIESPEEVIKEFYNLWGIEYVKIMIWKMLKGAVDSESQVSFTEDDDQVLIMDEQFVDIIFFIETFLMFYMAVYELNQRIKQQ